MRANVAIYTFAVCVFTAFMLWGTQNLGVIGLLGAFSVGLISYSMDSSLEMAVASTVLAGVVIKFILPYVQNKWIENYKNVDPKEVVTQIQGLQKTHADRVGQNRLPAVEQFTGLAPRLLEGFADQATAGASTPLTGTTNASATGAPAIPGQMPQGSATGVPAMTAPAVSQQMPQAPTTGAAVFAPNINTSGATAMSVPGTTPMMAQGTVTPAGGVTVSQPAGVVANQTMAPSSVIPGTASMAAPVGQAAPSTLINTGAVAGTGTAPQLAPSAPAQQATAATMNAALTTQPTVPGGAVAGIPGTGATAAPGARQGFRNVETFAEQPQEIPGMFKLGELPSDAKGGPHIDAGTTIMRSLGALNPNQISALTEDTRKLLDTQKSLMGMLTSMKPMLSDGQNLLASFNNMFGKS
jgi:hypothetical protein